MFNAIITGHGKFSIGMLDALEMIAGSQEKMKAIPFLEDDSLENYQNKIIDHMDELTKGEETLIVFTDLLGGTPFNTSMLLSSDKPNIFVIAGTNLPILLEFVVQRWADDEPKEVLTKLIETSKLGTVLGDIPKEIIVEEEDGI